MKLREAMLQAVKLEAEVTKHMPCEFSSKEPLPEAYRRAKDALEDFMNDRAADPELRKHMRCWMLDFYGKAEPLWHTKAQAALDRGEDPSGVFSPEEFVSAISGEVDDLSRRVSKWLTEIEAPVTDSGSGAGGWHLGANCTNEELDRITLAAHKEFAEELGDGTLTLRVMFWGWHFVESVAEVAVETETVTEVVLH